MVESTEASLEVGSAMIGLNGNEYMAMPHQDGVFVVRNVGGRGS